MPPVLVVTCQACVIRFESKPDAHLGEGGDATFRITGKVPPVIVCPRCGSDRVLVDVRRDTPDP